MSKILLAVYVLGFMALTCGGFANVSFENPVTKETHEQVSIEVIHPWVRPGDVGRNTAVYFEVKTSLADLKLVKAESPISHKTEIHTHIHDKGVMRMRAIDALSCPATLKPGGDHVMLMNLKEDLKENTGQVIPLTLHFSNGTHMLIEVPVRKS